MDFVLTTFSLTPRFSEVSNACVETANRFNGFRRAREFRRTRGPLKRGVNESCGERHPSVFSVIILNSTFSVRHL